ncbi:MAG: hypothetical protein AAB932_00485 [Patescibacteria group bacterium]
MKFKISKFQNSLFSSAQQRAITNRPRWATHFSSTRSGTQLEIVMKTISSFVFVFAFAALFAPATVVADPIVLPSGMEIRLQAYPPGISPPVQAEASPERAAIERCRDWVMEQFGSPTLYGAKSQICTADSQCAIGEICGKDNFGECRNPDPTAASSGDWCEHVSHCTDPEKCIMKKRCVPSQDGRNRSNLPDRELPKLKELFELCAAGDPILSAIEAAKRIPGSTVETGRMNTVAGFSNETVTLRLGAIPEDYELTAAGDLRPGEAERTTDTYATDGLTLVSHTESRTTAASTGDQ